MAGGAGYVAAVKLTREGEVVLSTAWLAGVLPNLVCAAVVPLAPLLSRRLLSGRDFLWMTLFTAIGLCLYEFTQVWMPRRTFDWDDVVATAVGAMVALVLGAGFFLLTGRKSAEPTAAPDPAGR
ncbi:VanZ family protein [Urbifossiella limnaea]|uniref:VanZ-like domain-containing protein n=1 Tax=Urbifossiella limnaea TaxID=2528023 RepID=A0A517XUM0_9BACT|nr:VanZ family protein [Urbifossiella limnaea]QDU21200.1 hypothetical protein ETAA1_31650 [Urbifossiella limnaea]